MGDPQHQNWHAESLWRQLEPVLPGLTVEVLARVDSTNTVLIERARQAGGRRSEDSLPCLLVAEHQTRGRGRQGRDWRAEAGGSLTFSLALTLAPADWSGLSLAVGLALADALDPVRDGSAPRIGLKWPNDLWLWEGPGRGRKLGGILIETVNVASRRMAVVGVGLNLRPLPEDESMAALSQGFACLEEITTEVAAPDVLAQIALPLAQALRRFESAGLAPTLPGYARRDVLAGQSVITQGGQEQAGVADGIDADGALRVRAAGDVTAVGSGDVSVRLQDGDGPR